MTISTPAPPDILSAEHERDPYQTYRILLEHYPVLYHEGTKSWIVSRHEDLSYLLRHKSVTSDNFEWQLEPVLGRTILQMAGTEHAAHRKLLNPFFTGAGLDRFRPAIEGVAEMQARAFLDREAAAVRSGERARGAVELISEFTRTFPLSVVVAMLDLPREDRERLKNWYASTLAFMFKFEGTREIVDNGLRARQELGEYLFPVIAERRRHPGEDLISLLSQAEVDGTTMTDEEIRAFIALILTAGTGTTARSLANMFSSLLQNPDQLAALYDDPGLIDDAFAETLRAHTPTAMILREAGDDIELHDVTIPAGATIMCLLAAANRDPRKFSDPDRFDIFRTDNSTERAFRGSADHLAFADGRHFCAGAMLTQAEVQIAAGLLLANMRDMKLQGDRVPIEEGVVTRVPGSLEVSYVPV